MFFCSRMCGHSRLWALDMHTNKYVCSEAPAHCNKQLRLFEYVLLCTCKNTQTNTLSRFTSCAMGRYFK